MRIWLASPEEAPQVAGLLAAFRDWWGLDWPDDASFLASVRRLIGREDTEYLLGAPGEHDPPAAVAQLRYRWGLWWEAEDCWLEDLYVADAARGSGLGRAMVEAVLDRACARGCRRVELDVNDQNEPAQALYRALGFETGKSGGRDIFMRRRL
jgi:ribosomal protein S18 acetylase RimI-like enzyme